MTIRYELALLNAAPNLEYTIYLPSFLSIFLRQHKTATLSTLPSETPVVTRSIALGDSESTNLERWKNPKTPSTKLVALVDMLKEWEYKMESTMDKVIIYSQCRSMFTSQLLMYSSTTPSRDCRDCNA